MIRDFKSRIESTTVLLIMFIGLLMLTAGPAAAAERVTPCYEVRVEFRGREATQNIGGVQYFRWTYRVYGGSCINRALSNWVLQLCASTTVSGISALSVDASDPTGGMTSHYKSGLGPDPKSGIYGLKWDWMGGNPVDKFGEYDEFSFIASGPITTVSWWSKGSVFLVSGTTQGPGCFPVANGNMTWSALKNRHITGE